MVPKDECRKDRAQSLDLVKLFGIAEGNREHSFAPFEIAKTFQRFCDS